MHISFVTYDIRFGWLIRQRGPLGGGAARWPSSEFGRASLENKLYTHGLRSFFPSTNFMILKWALIDSVQRPGCEIWTWQTKQTLLHSPLIFSGFPFGFLGACSKTLRGRCTGSPCCRGGSFTCVGGRGDFTKSIKTPCSSIHAPALLAAEVAAWPMSDVYCRPPQYYILSKWKQQLCSCTGFPVWSNYFVHALAFLCIAQVAPSSESETCHAQVVPSSESDPFIAQVAPSSESDPFIAQVAPSSESETCHAQVAPSSESETFIGWKWACECGNSFTSAS